MSEQLSNYYDRDEMSRMAANNQHRQAIGGMWEEIGALQLGFLKRQGLSPEHRLLDIGCGSLRLGVLAVDYLNPGNYWGIDLNEVLLDAGYDREIVPAGLSDKLPRSNLITDGDFTFSGLPGNFDLAIAQSLFSHLPPDYLRKCLVNLTSLLTGSCDFYATFFIVQDTEETEPFTHEPAGVRTFPDRDPYHYTLAQLGRAADGLPWLVEFIGDWQHPRGQQMVRFRKSEG